MEKPKTSENELLEGETFTFRISAHGSLRAVVLKFVFGLAAMAAVATCVGFLAAFLSSTFLRIFIGSEATESVEITIGSWYRYVLIGFFDL